uniref:KIB1-4 beta-propeller domain-containing protein n=1 Tax=Oryza barthii TaxID=65489 RepID=A0A0D3HNM4_9ORYZ
MGAAASTNKQPSPPANENMEEEAGAGGDRRPADRDGVHGGPRRRPLWRRVLPWRAAAAAFRRHRHPTPRQPPCLLYACDAYGPGAAALYSPSTAATFRVPFRIPPAVAGAAHGWLFATDDEANPYLVNPVTGARATLPPITTLARVRSRETLVGGVVPSAAAGCVVLLVHMPFSELSFARPGDARWTSLSGVAELSFARAPDMAMVGGWGSILAMGELHHRQYWTSIVHNHKNGLFYLLRHCGSIFSLDLTGGGAASSSSPSPVARTVLRSPSPHQYSSGPKPTQYLAVTPRGELLRVTLRWHQTAIVAPPDASNGRWHVEHAVATTGVEVEEIRTPPPPLATAASTATAISVAGLGGCGDVALFLGKSSAACLPTEGFPMLRPNCAYLTDDAGGEAGLRRLGLRKREAAEAW